MEAVGVGLGIDYSLVNCIGKVLRFSCIVDWLKGHEERDILVTVRKSQIRCRVQSAGWVEL